MEWLLSLNHNRKENIMCEIIVIVEGGAVQAAYCDTEGISISVLDQDHNEECDLECDDKVMYENLQAKVDSNEFHAIY